MQPWAADLLKKRMSENSKDNPDAHCLPMGIMQLDSHPYPKKIIQTPTEVVMVYEASGTTIREVGTCVLGYTRTHGTWLLSREAATIQRVERAT